MEKGGKGIREILAYLKSSGKLWMLIAAAILGLVLIIFGNVSTENSDRTTSTVLDDKSKYDIISYSELLEKKIKSLCEQAYGVSDVSVAVTLESGFEYIYAVNTEKRSDGDSLDESYEYLVIKNGNQESTVYLKGKPPKIKGVGVVCSGGSDPNVQHNLINLISAGFDVSKNNIYISESKKSHKQ